MYLYTVNLFTVTMYSPNVTIERVPFRDDYLLGDFNTANHPKDINDKSVENLDYATEITRMDLSVWRDIINYPVVTEYTFTLDEIKIFKAAMKMSLITGMIPPIYSVEIMDAVRRLDTALIPHEQPTGWFFRFDGSSPKDGKRNWPIMSAQEIIEKIITSWRAHTCLNRGEDKIYLCKYDPTWDCNRELRVFVHSGTITCISQYNCYNPNTPFNSMFDGELILIIKNIVEKINNLLPELKKSFKTDNFICDVYIDEELNVKIVEFNPFGYWLCSGSALFHWIRDKDRLYNNLGKIYFRLYE